MPMQMQILPTLAVFFATLVEQTLSQEAAFVESEADVTMSAHAAGARLDCPQPLPQLLPQLLPSSSTILMLMLAFATAAAAMAVLLLIFHRQLIFTGLYVINTIIAGVLGSPQLSEAIVDLVARILQHPQTDKAISRVVGAVLKNEGTRHEISQVVVAVLADDNVRQSIGEVVSDA